MQDKFGSEHTINGYSFPAEVSKIQLFCRFLSKMSRAHTEKLILKISVLSLILHFNVLNKVIGTFNFIAHARLYHHLNTLTPGPPPLWTRINIRFLKNRSFDQSTGQTSDKWELLVFSNGRCL